MLEERARKEVERRLAALQGGHTGSVDTRPRSSDCLLFSFGGKSQRGRINTIAVYNKAEDTWKDLDVKLPER